MNVQSRHSATIERMRIARNVPTAENRRTWSPAPVPGPASDPIRIHPRLLRIAPQIATLLRVDDRTEIEAALVDLQTLFVRCGYHLGLRRSARQWKQQDAALARRGSLIGRSKRGRGRPVGAANWAAGQLGLGLATIWSEHGGRKPTRRFDAIGGSGECGPYWDFVALILSVLPARSQIKRKGQCPKVDHLVRASIDEFKAAREAPEEYRRRGLLDEHRWQEGQVGPPS
jgi:hypothetical protein